MVAQFVGSATPLCESVSLKRIDVQFADSVPAPTGAALALALLVLAMVRLEAFFTTLGSMLDLQVIVRLISPVRASS